MTWPTASPTLAGQLQVDVLLAASLQPGPEKQALSLAVLTPAEWSKTCALTAVLPNTAVPGRSIPPWIICAAAFD